MRRHRKKDCKYCGKMYQPTGQNERACADCKKHLANVQGQVVRDVQRFKKFGSYATIGKGQQQPTGSDSPHYTNGIGFFHKFSPVMRATKKFCERCGRDITVEATGKWGYAVHHKDHDRTHNEPENFELMCRRCHQIHHDCVDNLCVKNGTPLDDEWHLESATTIREE